LNFDFEDIINRIINILKIKNKAELCRIMNVSTATMGNWKTRNKIPYEEILLICEKYQLSSDYIFFGIGNLKEIELMIKGRLSEKVLNNFQPELLLFHEVFKSINPISYNSKEELIIDIQKFDISFTNKIFQINEQTKNNIIAFLIELSPEEYEYVIKYNNNFLEIIFQFRNFTNKIFTLDKVSS